MLHLLSRRTLRLHPLFMFTLVIAACGDSGSTAGTSTTLTILEPATVTRGDDVVDSIEVEGFDDDGNLIYGPRIAPFENEMSFEDVPEEVSHVQLDYLRNGGLALYRADMPVGADRMLNNPEETAVEAHTTSFSIVQDMGGAYNVQVTTTGPATSTVENALGSSMSTTTTSNMRLKGVCYSPAPINFSNKNGPALGDLFWDTYTFTNAKTGEPDTEYNWYGLWGTGELTPGNYAREDLTKIRNLGANTIRVYSMISRQLETNGDIPTPMTGHKFTHKQFLDKAWNNGTNPLYVLIDIPMPGAAFKSDVAPTSGQLAFWDSVIVETAKELANHPAVLGFNIMNEQDQMNDSYPNQGAGPDDSNTDFFYAQSVAYAGDIKTNAPDKLVGWALHDVPDFVKFASQFPTTGQTYMEQLSDFDYWGINTYQTSSFTSIFGDNDGSYSQLTGTMKKPVLFTEFGMPATGHNAMGGIMESAATRTATAAFVTTMYPMAFDEDLLLGSYYFEYQDEWWKQPPNIAYEWNPGAEASNFPNGYWDEEGFGLYSTATDGRVDNSNPWGGSGPVLPMDTLTERTEITTALSAAFAGVD
ncbi:MAG: hypothetical protein WBG86_02635 [Polyangiales bacterium]